MNLDQNIFNVYSKRDFEKFVMKVYRFQYNNCLIYQQFCNILNKTPEKVKTKKDIPFLPIEFFKKTKIIHLEQKETIIFTSSGTTGNNTSKHYVSDVSIYQKSYLRGFSHFYGDIENYCVLALLPSYSEREGSSLIYMIDDLIQKSNHLESGYFLNDFDLLINTIKKVSEEGVTILLIGVTYALLELVEYACGKSINLKDISNSLIVMETGGMKGRRREMIREEVHTILKNNFGLPKIHSEYGMTELLSQAYSLGNGLFECPPWMEIIIRDTEDPFSILENEKTGGVNIIDLANINSCAFIATQDLGKCYSNGTFEIIGRFDNSDIRGCNLLVQ